MEFFIGLFVGVLLGVGIMCIFQINRTSELWDLIDDYKELLARHRETSKELIHELKTRLNEALVWVELGYKERFTKEQFLEDYKEEIELCGLEANENE